MARLRQVGELRSGEQPVQALLLALLGTFAMWWRETHPSTRAVYACACIAFAGAPRVPRLAPTGRRPTYPTP